MDKYDLARFVDAQEKHYDKALWEIRNGCKWGHWIWYIFPQMRGLGQSSLSDYYGIADLKEAADYLAHPVLSSRLREITQALLGNEGKTATEIFSQIDALKVRSSMTLFDMVSPNDVFGQVLDKFYGGSRDGQTGLILRLQGVQSPTAETVKPANRGIIGAIIGDIVGSRFEFIEECESVNFELFTQRNDFTDDSVMTCAVADWLSSGRDLVESMRDWGHRYPNRGYGGMFQSWLLFQSDTKPYNSFGNGSGMRVSPVGFYARSLEEALDLAKQSAEVTHNHPEGIKGAQAIASAIYFARTGRDKEYIRDFVEQIFGYDLHRDCDEIRPTYGFDVTCQGSCPESIIAFLDSTDYESAIRLAVSLGGDSDTIACMTGGIAAAYYGVPDSLVERAMEYLPDDMLEVISIFDKLNIKGTMNTVYTPEYITELKPNEIFVFGSNLDGYHAGGAARVALHKFGAIWGQGVGLQGQSYAIPTMQGGIETIKPYVDEFIAFAQEHPEFTFYVTRIGCGIAGFSDNEIAPLFYNALAEKNIILPKSFIAHLL